jgi:hypothetical protein
MDLSRFLAPQHAQDKRISICQECDRYVGSTERCSECSCYMPWKIKMAPANCPLNKWLHETIHVNAEQT